MIADADCESIFQIGDPQVQSADFPELDASSMLTPSAEGSDALGRVRSGIHGKPTASAKCRVGIHGSGRLPQNAEWEITEADGFRKMPVGKSRKRRAPVKYRSGVHGSGRLPQN